MLLGVGLLGLGEQTLLWLLVGDLGGLLDLRFLVGGRVRVSGRSSHVGDAVLRDEASGRRGRRKRNIKINEGTRRVGEKPGSACGPL